MLSSTVSGGRSKSSTGTLYSRLFLIILWGLVVAASVWVAFGLFGLCWPEDNAKGPVLRSSGLVDSATSIAALHLLAELSKRNPQGPSAEQVVAAQRLLALLDSAADGGNGGGNIDSNGARRQTPRRSLGSMTSSVRELAETIVNSASSPGSFHGILDGSKGADGEKKNEAPSSSSKTGDENTNFEELYKDRLFTQQTCYIQSDESEMCTFENLMCFDGTSPIVTVETPIRDPERILDYTHACK